jgi:alanine dehydrogenase
LGADTGEIEENGMTQLTVGLLAHSRKPAERRLPIHPLHLGRIDADLRRRVFVERGYGERFGVSDDVIVPLVGGVRSRAELVADCDVVLLPKPLPADLAELRDGQVLWGWPHCVQDEAITQLAIDKRLTVIAWEAMNFWKRTGGYDLHVFHQNNELAGYCSVLHALQLLGLTGSYGRPLRAAVISFGATARGAVTALTALGITDVTVLTHRDKPAVASPIHSTELIRFATSPDDPSSTVAFTAAGEVPMATLLAEHDIVVNCVLQDTDAPLMFVNEQELKLFAPGTVFVDVSCDEGMGFAWARPTSFAEPMFTIGDNVHYYAVDHSPSHLWNSATWAISEALLPHLQTVLDGPTAWDASATIRRAIEIRAGVIQNPKILSFQGRSPDYPHRRS